MKKIFLSGLILSVLVFLAGASISQEKAPLPQLRTEIVKLNYLDAGTADLILRSYLSREGHVSRSPDKADLIVISDHPEIVEKILAVIKEIDIKPVDLLFTIRLVLGSETADEKSDESIKNDPIIKELAGLLRYKNFTLLDTSLIRTVDRKMAILALGEKAEFSLYLLPKCSKQDREDVMQVDVALRRMSWVNPSPGAQKEVRELMLISTTLTLKSGDKTVVGVSKMDGGDKGLILIISGKVIG